MTDPLTVTELDVLDPEITAMRVYVVCEECGDTGEVMDMVRDGDRAWLCHPCKNGFAREWEIQQEYLRRLPW